MPSRPFPSNLLTLSTGQGLYPAIDRKADTTRAPRPGERDGIEYNFTTTEPFLKLVDEGGFIEHAQFGSNHYGTSVKAVQDVAEEGRICVLDIEMEVRPVSSSRWGRCEGPDISKRRG